MRDIKILGIVALVLATASCAGSEPAGRTGHVPDAVASEPTTAPAPQSEPIVIVENEAAMHCDAQGIAHYPDGFVPEREPKDPQGSWEGTEYRLSYAAMVTVPGAVPGAPPVQQLKTVECVVQLDGGKLIVTRWTAA